MGKSNKKTGKMAKKQKMKSSNTVDDILQAHEEITSGMKPGTAQELQMGLLTGEFYKSITGWRPWDDSGTISFNVEALELAQWFYKHQA